VYYYVSPDTQEASMDFLVDHVFKTPEWLIDENILMRIEPSGEIKRISDIQTSILENLLMKDRLVRMLEAESLQGTDTYTCLDMMEGVRKGIWSDLSNDFSADIYKRNLQIFWIDNLSEFLYRFPEDKKNSVAYAGLSALALNELLSAKEEITSRLSVIREPMAKSHFLYCVKRIEDIIERCHPVK
jgi:hypothetical protein